MENNLVNIFIGSDIEVNYIASLLSDNQIECIIRNTLEESLSAGWVSGSMYNSSIIRVSVDDIEKSKQIIDEYLKINKENNSTIIE